MATVDVIRDMPQKPLAPVDPDVKIPDSVKAAAARAESYYKAKPTTPAPAKEAIPQPPQAEEKPVETQPVTPEPEPAKEPVTEAAPEPPKRPVGRPRKVAPPEGQEAPQAAPAPQSAPTGQEPNWEHMYLSMKGRHDALLRSQGTLQEQMNLMSDELLRMQQALNSGANQQQSQPYAKKLVTEDDVKTYGPELIDLAKRVAGEVVGPELEASQNEIKQLKQKLAYNAQLGVQARLDAEIPDWRVINLDPRFKSWLNKPNIYSGRIRHQMLQSAYEAANAPLVVQLFRDFIADEEATGNIAPAPSSQQPQSAPRKAAVPLEQLAAPGRARPAGGDTAVPADKPRFTRSQIAKFYAAVRAGAFAGREVEKNRQEEEIFAAQREGRVTG